VTKARNAVAHGGNRQDHEQKETGPEAADKMPPDGGAV